MVRTDYRVETEKPIRAQGYRIALVSDLHFGTTMDGRDLAGYAGEIEAAGPDLLVLCGDIAVSYTHLRNTVRATDKSDCFRKSYVITSCPAGDK